MADEGPICTQPSYKLDLKCFAFYVCGVGINV